MKCLKCNIEMECMNDVRTTEIKMDFLICPKCKSNGYINYNPKTYEIEEYCWKSLNAMKKERI